MPSKDAATPDRCAAPGAGATARHLLITAGPTHEPIDAVRYIGNRSTGRLGVALADAAASRGWRITLLLGPTALAPTDSRVRLRRFRTAADLEAMLGEEFPIGPAGAVDVLVMAAAVADYRPVVPPGQIAAGKLRRTGGPLSLTLEPTPDLLAGCSLRRQPGQVLVGFALEPRESLLESARSKLTRKGLDLIVANPLETMDGPTIEATLIGADGSQRGTPGGFSKERFAPWLLEAIEAIVPGGR